MTPAPVAVPRWVVRTSIILAAVTTAAIVALTAVGATVGPPTPGVTGTSPALGPARTLPSEGYYTLAPDRRATYPPWLTLDLPAAPFTQEGAELTDISGFSSEAALFIVASHPAFVPNVTWPPAVMAGPLVPATVIAGDTRATADGLLRELAPRFYRGLTGLIVETSTTEAVTQDGYRGDRATLTVKGSMPDGRQHSAQLSLLVLELDPSHHFGFVEVRPDGITAAESAAMEASRASIRRLR